MAKKQTTQKTNGWRWLAHFWAISTMILFITEFFRGDQFATAATTTAIIYIAMLGIFASTKEITRWQINHLEKHFGECFIFLWSGLMFLYIIALICRPNYYQMPKEFIPTYIAVLGVFAITQHSKQLYKNKLKK